MAPDENNAHQAITGCMANRGREVNDATRHEKGSEHPA
jgi:hypothetical protein